MVRRRRRLGAPILAGAAALATMLATGATPAALAATAPPPTAAAAVVNKTTITYGEMAQRTELYAFLAPNQASQLAQPQYQGLILQRMIQEILVEQAAAHAHLSLSRTAFASEADKSYASLIGSGYANASAMDQALKADHLSRHSVIADLELQYALDAVLQKLVKKAPIPASAIQAYYKAHQSQFTAPPAYELRVIVVQTKALAQTLLHKVVAARGADFGTLAEEYSIDTASAPEQGDLGWVTLAQLGAGVNQAVPKMKVGGYALVNTPNGWDVLQLVATRPAGRQSLKAATVSITKTLASQHFQTSAKAYLTALTKSAKVRVLWHPVGTSSSSSSTNSGTKSKK